MTLSIEHDLFNDTKQWVCLQCGYNMIGAMPEICPFCGAYHDQFLPWDEAETKYHVTEFTINNEVTQLLSVPKLGYEHAAYRIETAEGAVWIDSPSAFNRGLAPVDAILFTHHHFMGASNQYRQIWNAEIWLHDLDARHRLAASFTVDRRFFDDFSAYGIEAYHIGGHTPGFTFYIYKDVLFLCDYVFLTDAGMSFNPYGPEQETIKQAQRIYEVVKHRSLKTVCGYNYTVNFADWMAGFERLIGIW
jgi:glyoxylase-like metal-dependent hydrolase (beta-lactamase superfamily II)